MTVDLEAALRRYRPSGPPRGLRERCVAADDRRAVPEWLLPAAAAVAALVFYGLASGVQRDLLQVEVGNEAREAAIAAIATDLGGDDLARMQAERVMNLIENQPRDDRDLLALLPGEVMTP